MKKIVAFIATATAVVTGSTAFAGGPVVVEPEPEPMVMTGPVSSFGQGALIAGLAALAVVALVASDSDSSSTTP